MMRTGLFAIALAAGAALLRAIWRAPPSPVSDTEETLTSLFTAIATGNTDRVRTLLEQRTVSPHAADSLGRTALHVAAAGAQANPQLVTLLLHFGMPISAEDVSGETALLIAVVHSDSQAAVTALLEATLTDCEQSRRCSRPYIREALFHAAALAKPAELVAALAAAALHRERTHDAWADRLAAAAIRGEARELERLLRTQADEGLVSSQWVTPLHLAVAMGHAQAVEVLLADGAWKQRNTVDHLWSCLFASLRRGNVRMAESILAELEGSASGPGVGAPSHALFHRSTWDAFNTSDTAVVADAYAAAAARMGVDCEGIQLVDFEYASVGGVVRGLRATVSAKAGARLCRAPQRAAVSLEVLQLEPALVSLREACLGGGRPRWTCDLIAMSAFALHQASLSASYLTPLVRLHLADELADSLPLASDSVSTSTTGDGAAGQSQQVEMRRTDLRQTIDEFQPILLAGAWAEQMVDELCHDERWRDEQQHQLQQEQQQEEEQQEQQEDDELEVQACRRLLNSTFSAHRLLRMAAAVYSRMTHARYGVFYPLTALNHPEAWNPLSERGRGIALVADLPNHAHLVFSRESLEAGDELVFNYGDYCAETFDAIYGFHPRYARPCAL